MADLFIDEINLYEVNYLLSKKKKPPVTLSDLQKWLPSQSEILSMETLSNKLYILDSLNESFVNSDQIEEPKFFFPKFNTYDNEVMVTRPLDKKINMRRRASKRYLSEAKGLHARISTVEDQMESITLDSMMSKKTLEI